MSQHAPSLTGQTLPSADSDYDSILGAVMETARGRWFLHEYVRRNRNTDTGSLLAAIDRIELLLKAKAVEQPEFEGQTVTGAEAVASSVETIAGSIRSTGEQLREIADCLVECGAPRYLCNDLTSRVGELTHASEQVAAAADDIRALRHTAPDAALPDAADQAASVDAMSEVLAEQPPRRDPFADIRALSAEEKIALFT